MSQTLEPAPVESLRVAAFTVPTDAPESDGTIRWEDTTLVAVEARAGGEVGLGYTYGHRAAVALIAQKLGPLVLGRPVTGAPEGVWQAMVDAVRNLGRPGLAAHAISAVDAALWDLTARSLDVPLVDLLGRAHDRLPVYGSGGFTSYDDGRLTDQLASWTAAGIDRVKMKTGRDPADDPRRVALARRAVGDDVALFVDANGALDVASARLACRWLTDLGVTWFEEPVSSDDLPGMRRVRDAAPGLAITAGEYGYDLWTFRRMLAAEAVDVIQADATRCLGITGFRKVAILAEAFHVPLSTHTAPGLHLHPACAARPAVHLEYFHDHVRIERTLFDGLPALEDGCLAPDRTRPGHGLRLRWADAEAHRVAEETIR
ncbi:MAG TPA: enolase C-terminal domain-like protein [Sandaracinaceae bacterium LLY-WYZ-13_1]|nr:enolase C-terminal domain-like protein [Sandaracinaceae bacterium LLY-WYZ-13_1]